MERLVAVRRGHGAEHLVGVLWKAKSYNAVVGFRGSTRTDDGITLALGLFTTLGFDSLEDPSSQPARVEWISDSTKERTKPFRYNMAFCIMSLLPLPPPPPLPSSDVFSANVFHSRIRQRDGRGFKPPSGTPNSTPATNREGPLSPKLLDRCLCGVEGWRNGWWIQKSGIKAII